MTDVALIVPTPRFAIGDTVYVAQVERAVEQLPCPDCLGSGKWNVRSPAGGEYTTSCPRCQQTYSLRNDLPSLKVEHWVGKALARRITGMEIHVGRPVEYRAAIGGGSSWMVYEDKAWLAEDEAQAAANEQAAGKNTAASAKPEVLTARHFATLTLDEGRWDTFKNGLWNTQYHAGCLIEKVKEAVHGEDGETESTPAEVVDNLREILRWDMKYHVDNLPLRPVIVAALQSADTSVKTAAEALPEAMKKLLAGTFEDGFA